MPVKKKEYEVVFEFLDLEDNEYHYKVGDTFPREGKKVTQKRIDELSGKSNKIGRPLIK